jgi:hypothetical protein
MIRKAGLWIDHQKAVIVSLSKSGVSTHTIQSGVEGRTRMSGGSRSKTTYGPQDIASEKRRDARHRHHLDRYYDEVISNISDAEEVLILGPGEAKKELKKRMERLKTLSKRIVGVEVSDKLTEKQLISKLMSFFKYAD